jgi:hypothetical protein
VARGLSSYGENMGADSLLLIELGVPYPRTSWVLSSNCDNEEIEFGSVLICSEFSFDLGKSFPSVCNTPIIE